MALRLMSVVCLVLLPMVPVHGDRCVLHNILINVEQWETQVSYVGKMKASFIRFHGEYMNETRYGPLGEDEIQRECVASYSDNKYLYKWEEKSVTFYRCYQLIPISTNVVVVKVSETTTNLETANSICASDDVSLQYIEWPLISTRTSPGSAAIDCGIEGGFDFYVRLNGMEYCQQPDNSMRPRLEVGCSKQPAMNFDFRNNFNCRGFLDMKLQQRLVCLGNWQRGPYRFSVVTDNADLWPKIWMLRFPANIPATASFEMLVLPDIKMDMSPNPVSVELSYVHTLVMKRTDIVTVCEDEATAMTCASRCSDQFVPDSVQLDDVHCQKSCDKCPQDQGQCLFPLELKGEWLEYGEMGTRRVALTSSIMYVEGLPPMKCLNLTGSIDNKQPVVSFYRNGCKPEYRCIYLRARGPNIIQYDVSELLPWPYKNSLTSADICQAGHFTSPSSPYRVPDPSILIKTVGKQPVDCKIRGTFLFIGRRIKSGDKAACSGIITSCDFKDVFRIEYMNNCDEDSQSYQCIASFDEGTSRILITEGEDRLGRLNQCWIIHRFKGDVHTTVYQVPLSSCHVPQLAIDRRQENGDYVMMYNVSGELELRDEGTCKDHIQVTTRTDAVMMTLSTTQKMDLVTQHIPPNTPTTEKPYNISEMLLKASSGADYVMASVSLVIMSLMMMMLIV